MLAKDLDIKIFNIYKIIVNKNKCKVFDEI